MRIRGTTKTETTVPRKRGARKPRTSAPVGKSVVHEWKDGTGMVRVGRTTVQIMKGGEDLSTWTDEELMRGARMKTSRIPNVIPMAIYVELINRVTSQVRHRFAAELTVAVEQHMRLIKRRDTPPAVKLKAIELLYDRVMGKTPDHVVLHDADAPWRKLVASAIVGEASQVEEAMAELQSSGVVSEGEIVEGEIVEEAS